MWCAIGIQTRRRQVNVAVAQLLGPLVCELCRQWHLENGEHPHQQELLAYFWRLLSLVSQ